MSDYEFPDVPLSLEENIRWSLLMYPTIHKSRGDVLHHMYFVLGNGYEWVDGRLIDRSWTQAHAEKLIADGLAGRDPYARYKEVNDDPVWQLAVDKMIARSIKEYRAAQDNIEERLRLRGFGSKPYPYSKLSMFFEIPEEVDLDYLEGAMEAAEDYLERQHQEHIMQKLNELRKKRLEDLDYLGGAIEASSGYVKMEPQKI